MGHSFVWDLVEYKIGNSITVFISIYFQSAPVSTGNLYYYYYPVAAYPLNEKADEDELDPLVLVLLPVALLVGFLALVSIFSKNLINLKGYLSKFYFVRCLYLTILRKIIWCERVLETEPSVRVLGAAEGEFVNSQNYLLSILFPGESWHFAGELLCCSGEWELYGQVG